MTYDLEYFIAKFEAIPAEKWCTGLFTDYDGRYCALGHCGARTAKPLTDETKRLLRAVGGPLLRDTQGLIANINDGKDGWDSVADNSRDRILAALRGIRDGYDPRERVKA
jgi:hypothetical protein